MDDVIDSIRAAVAADATPDAKAAGIASCRTILAALDATPGQPIVPPPSISPIAAMVGALRGVPPDQLLDVAIARLRAALPAGAESTAPTPLKMHIITLPKLGAR